MKNTYRYTEGKSLTRKIRVVLTCCLMLTLLCATMPAVAAPATPALVENIFTRLDRREFSSFSMGQPIWAENGFNFSFRDHYSFDDKRGAGYRVVCVELNLATSTEIVQKYGPRAMVSYAFALGEVGTYNTHVPDEIYTVDSRGEVYASSFPHLLQATPQRIALLFRVPKSSASIDYVLLMTNMFDDVPVGPMYVCNFFE